MAVAIVASSISFVAAASVTWTGFFDTSWIEVAGPYNTITFSEFPQYTNITDQYKDLGVTFTAAGRQPPFQSPYVWFNDQVFPRDGVGIVADTGFQMQLAQPTYAIGVYLFSHARLRLFSGTELVGDSLFWGSSGAATFVGGVSTLPFDRVTFDGPYGTIDDPVFIDDIVIGIVPAPTSALLLLAPLLGRRRRR